MSNTAGDRAGRASTASRHVQHMRLRRGMPRRRRRHLRRMLPRAATQPSWRGCCAGATRGMVARGAGGASHLHVPCRAAFLNNSTVQLIVVVHQPASALRSPAAARPAVGIMTRCPARPARRRWRAEACAALLLAVCATLSQPAAARGAAARAASASSGGSSAGGGSGAVIVGALTAVLDTSPAASASIAAVTATAQSTLRGVSLRCAGAYSARRRPRLLRPRYARFGAPCGLPPR